MHECLWTSFVGDVPSTRMNLYRLYGFACMLNPLVVDQRYQNILLLLSLPAAALHRLRTIDEFTQYVAQDGEEYSSYLIDCALRLPRIIKDLRPVGQDPEILRGILNRLTKVLAIGGADSEALIEALRELRRFVALCYSFVGALDNTLRVLIDGQPDPVEGTTECATSLAKALAAAASSFSTLF